MVTAYDDLEDKEQFYRLIKNIENKYEFLKNDMGYISKSLLAIYYMIQDKFYPDDPFQAG
jgi:hypothetical protein